VVVQSLQLLLTLVSGLEQICFDLELVSRLFLRRQCLSLICCSVVRLGSAGDNCLKTGVSISDSPHDAMHRSDYAVIVSFTTVKLIVKFHYCYRAT